jgi:hypothetical protein
MRERSPGHAPRRGPKHTMSRHMTGDTTNERTLDAALRLRRSCAGKDDSDQSSRKRHDDPHVSLLTSSGRPTVAGSGPFLLTAARYTSCS